MCVCVSVRVGVRMLSVYRLCVLCAPESHQSFQSKAQSRKTEQVTPLQPPKRGNMKAKFLLLHFAHVVAVVVVKHLLQVKLFIKLKLFKNYVKYVLRVSLIVLLSRPVPPVPLGFLVFVL